MPSMPSYDKLHIYLKSKFNIPIEKHKLNKLINTYNDGKYEYKQIINTIFITLFGVSIESLHVLSESYNITEINDLDEMTKELYGKINDLSKEINELKIENEELRTNYWKLNKTVINTNSLKF